jgi:hypothetical protein
VSQAGSARLPGRFEVLVGVEAVEMVGGHRSVPSSWEVSGRMVRVLDCQILSLNLAGAVAVAASKASAGFR